MILSMKLLGFEKKLFMPTDIGSAQNPTDINIELEKAFQLFLRRYDFKNKRNNRLSLDNNKSYEDLNTQQEINEQVKKINTFKSLLVDSFKEKIIFILNSLGNKMDGNSTSQGIILNHQFDFFYNFLTTLKTNSSDTVTIALLMIQEMTDVDINRIERLNRLLRNFDDGFENQNDVSDPVKQSSSSDLYQSNYVRLPEDLEKLLCLTDVEKESWRNAVLLNGPGIRKIIVLSRYPYELLVAEESSSGEFKISLVNEESKTTLLKQTHQDLKIGRFNKKGELILSAKDQENLLDSIEDFSDYSKKMFKRMSFDDSQNRIIYKVYQSKDLIGEALQASVLFAKLDDLKKLAEKPASEVNDILKNLSTQQDNLLLESQNLLSEAINPLSEAINQLSGAVKPQHRDSVLGFQANISQDQEGIEESIKRTINDLIKQFSELLDDFDENKLVYYGLFYSNNKWVLAKSYEDLKYDTNNAEGSILYNGQSIMRGQKFEIQAKQEKSEVKLLSIDQDLQKIIGQDLQRMIGPLISPLISPLLQPQTSFCDLPPYKPSYYSSPDRGLADAPIGPPSLLNSEIYFSGGPIDSPLEGQEGGPEKARPPQTPPLFSSASSFKITRPAPVEISSQPPAVNFDPPVLPTPVLPTPVLFSPAPPPNLPKPNPKRSAPPVLGISQTLTRPKYMEPEQTPAPTLPRVLQTRPVGRHEEVKSQTTGGDNPGEMNQGPSFDQASSSSEREVASSSLVFEDDPGKLLVRSEKSGVLPPAPSPWEVTSDLVFDDPEKLLIDHLPDQLPAPSPSGRFNEDGSKQIHCISLIDIVKKAYKKIRKFGINLKESLINRIKRSSR